MNMAAKVVKLTRFPVKKEPGIDLAELTLVTGHGVSGDAHKDGDRQVSLLSKEAREWIEAQTIRGLCHSRYKENILIDGLPDNLPEGTVLKIGDAVLRIVTPGKECFDECFLHSGNLPCKLSQSAAFAKVKHDGVVRVGDIVDIFTKGTT